MAIDTLFDEKSGVVTPRKNAWRQLYDRAFEHVKADGLATPRDLGFLAAVLAYASGAPGILDSAERVKETLRGTQAQPGGMELDMMPSFDDGAQEAFRLLGYVRDASVAKDERN